MNLKINQIWGWLNKPAVFAVAQLCVLSVTAFGGIWCWNSLNRRPTVPALNNSPRQVRPLYDHSFVVTDQQLKTVLRKTQPSFAKNKPPKTNFVDHALRMWGADVQFGNDALDGSQMRSLLLDHDEFTKAWGVHANPLLKDTVNGIGVTTQEGNSSVSHIDHLVGTLAEIGTPLDFPVSTKMKKGNVGELLQNALRSFSLNQREYEWTVLALAFYVTDGGDWASFEGQNLNFDMLAKRMMRQQQPQGVCYGQHRLYSLTMLIRIDQQIRADANRKGLLSAEMSSQVYAYLMSNTKQLFKSQSLEGYWDGNWPDQRLAIPDPQSDELSRRVLATGHTLEWWAMAPEELLPPRETIVRAAQWLAKTIIEMDQQQIRKNYTFLTHAARSLALWRAVFPGEFEQHRIASNRSRYTKP